MLLKVCKDVYIYTLATVTVYIYTVTVARQFIILLIFSLSCLCFFFPSLSHSSFTLYFNHLSGSSSSSSIFSTLFFSTSVSSQPSSKRRTRRPLCRRWLRRELEEAPINLHSRSRGMGLINLRSDQPWVLAWMGMGFGSNQPWEWETKKAQSK